MTYKKLECERPYQKATIGLDAGELWLIQSMFFSLEKSGEYKDNKEFNNLRKEFFLLYNLVNDGFVGERTLEIITEMVNESKEEVQEDV